jgi:hypothetical protein
MVQEVGFGFVCVQPTIMELEWFGWWEGCGFIVYWQEVCVFVL